MENSNKSVGIGRVEITSALVTLVAGMIFPQAGKQHQIVTKNSIIRSLMSKF